MLGNLTNKRGGAASSINLRPLQIEMTPKRPFYAVGDVHGCLDQMQAALSKIDDDIEALEIDDPMLVFLGDYVDRGPKSAQVLDELFHLSLENPDDLICLMGNHERMMLDFLDTPLKAGPRWLRFGGMETLESYSIEGVTHDAGPEQLYEACEELWDALPEGLEPWLRNLPLRWSSGNLHCVHAAFDPALPIRQQSQDVMLWGCDSFLKTARNDGNWVIHGHTVVDKAIWEHSRISLDTGCYFTGELTAAAFTSNTCRIL
ncbi:MAG: metallophosphoesterase family protein [Planktotalea sp.]|uniref:metallophosphoesterase family protein n=1 Tax=Planktotalea sp. TaxID=2029877 RepID=UPI003C73DEEA